MKHIPYRQNPTVIDTSKSPTTTGENYVYQYELSNHLNTAYNTYTSVRAFRTGVFCCSKILKNPKIFGVFSKGSIAPRKGEAPPTFQRERGENVEPNRREFIKQCAFQKFCNTVLHNEACDAHKELAQA